MQKKYPTIIIKQQTRNIYYSALSQADNDNYLPFIEFLAENMIHSQEIYIKVAKGESLSEPDDFDKEMALFQKQLEGEPDNIKKIKSKETLEFLIEKSIIPLIENIELKLKKIKELFINYGFAFAEIYEEEDEDIYYKNWYYNKAIINNTKINEKLIKNFNKETNRTILVYQFSDFKKANNSFGIELKLMLEFNKFEYKILYNISEINELQNKLLFNFMLLNTKTLANNYYHQNLSEKEISEFSNKIASDLLNLATHVKLDNCQTLLRVSDS